MGRCRPREASSTIYLQLYAALDGGAAHAAASKSSTPCHTAGGRHRPFAGLGQYREQAGRIEPTHLLLTGGLNGVWGVRQQAQALRQAGNQRLRGLPEAAHAVQLTQLLQPATQPHGPLFLLLTRAAVKSWLQHYQWKRGGHMAPVEACAGSHTSMQRGGGKVLECKSRVRHTAHRGHCRA